MNQFNNSIEDPEENLPEKRKTIKDLFLLKVNMLERLNEIQNKDKEISDIYKSIDGYSPIDLKNGFPHMEQREEKHIDRTIWWYILRQFGLQKYMLCTEYKKLCNDINQYVFPPFTIENVESWVEGLKALIYDNVRTLVKTVFTELTEQTYHTGGWNSPKKKRNNNGVDKVFILGAMDHRRIFGYDDRPTITDDLEKVCYILDGKKVPDITIINKMKKEKSSIGHNDYFQIKAYKTNTHYKFLNEEIRAKINLYGGDPSRIGENIRIKIFDRW
jgi:hypothetical protein